MADGKEIYLSELVRWNKSINLVSPSDIPRLSGRHYEDSLSALPYIGKGARLLDVGSGNGFPSIPIALSRPDVSVVAVEPRGKRAIFLSNIKALTKLSNYTILNSRLEQLPPSYYSSFDVITARAFKSGLEVLNMTVQYLMIVGKVILFNDISEKELEDKFNVLNIIVNSVDKHVYTLSTGEQKVLSIMNITKK